METLVTTTVAPETPASPLKADVVSLEAIELSEKKVTKKNPVKRYLVLLNIEKSPLKMLYTHYVHNAKINKKKIKSYVNLLQL